MQIKLIETILSLVVETARSIKTGCVNGTMDRALEAALQAKNAYSDHLNAVAAGQIAG